MFVSRNKCVCIIDCIENLFFGRSNIPSKVPRPAAHPNLEYHSLSALDPRSWQGGQDISRKESASSSVFPEAPTKYILTSDPLHLYFPSPHLGRRRDPAPSQIATPSLCQWNSAHCCITCTELGVLNPTVSHANSTVLIMCMGRGAAP